MPLPNKFEICTKYNRTTRYILTLNAQGYYEMAPAERSLEYAYDVLKKYSQGFVKEAVQDGMWEITANLDKVEVAIEPEMVFPLTVQNSFTKNVYDVVKGSREGWVTLKAGNGVDYENHATVCEIKSFIKDGTWLVKHVGEKIEDGAVKATYLKVGDLSKITVQSGPLDIAKLTITADTDAAVGAVERLTQALEDLAASYESVIALQREFKEGV